MVAYVGGIFSLKKQSGIWKALAVVTNPALLLAANQPTQPAPVKPAAPAPKPPAKKPAPAPKAKSAIATPSPLVPASRPAGQIGIYVSNSPDDPSARATLDLAASLGVNVVYNYSAFHSPPNEVRGYLDHAAGRGIKVIISLKDLYDQLGNSQVAAYSQWYGGSNEEIALNVVRQFKDHPATWGFATTDEAPESPAELGTWAPILRDRYLKIKAITSLPVMQVLVGHTSANAGSRRSFLSSLRSGTDTFALDYYPVPYMSQEKITEIAADLPAVGDNNGWFVAQCFSWQSYSATAQGLGFNVGAARLPNTTEMINMSRYALAGGARNIMFYSLFDISANSAQISALRAAIAAIK